VAQGELSQRIPEETQSELGYLERSFNSMTGALGQARAHVDELMAGLEEQVKERTDALKRIQEQLIHAEKMTSLGKLSASIAHEINNPLMGILTSSKLLARIVEDSELPERDRKIYLRQLHLVQREAERCRTIVRHLLDFARQRSLELKPIDINAAVEEALSLAANQIKLQGISLKTTLAPRVEIRGDFGQIRQALLNMIINACDAMPEGGELTVRTESLERERKVAVVIGDTGVGIAGEHLSRIFDPFFTTKEKGTGLGLSVVYGIINRHGGAVEIDSAPGKGTRIRLRLPVTGPGAGEVQEAA
jgi:two-component system, NtrC family, sensor kinase